MALRRKILSVRAVATLKEPGRHADGGNLYLNVTKSGARSWVFMYSRAGRQREMGLGSALDISLSKARDLADLKTSVPLQLGYVQGSRADFEP